MSCYASCELIRDVTKGPLSILSEKRRETRSRTFATTASVSKPFGNLSIRSSRSLDILSVSRHLLVLLLPAKRKARNGRSRTCKLAPLVQDLPPRQGPPNLVSHNHFLILWNSFLLGAGIILSMQMFILPACTRCNSFFIHCIVLSLYTIRPQPRSPPDSISTTVCPSPWSRRRFLKGRG